MKFIGRMLVLIILSASLLVMTACGLFHEHTMQDQLVNAPSCTEIGLLKRYYTDCGETEYIELSRAEHKAPNGVCTECGAYVSEKKELLPFDLPQGASADSAWSMQTIYQTATGVGFSGSYERFLRKLSGTELSDASINSLRMLSITVLVTDQNGEREECPLIYKVDPVNIAWSGAPIGILEKAEIKDSALYLSYRDGDCLLAGSFLESSAMSIIGFGINAERELIVYYSDDTVAYAGVFPS